MMAALRFRELPALVPGKRDCFMADPRKIVVDPDYNCRDMKSAETTAHVEWLAESIAMEGFTSILEVTRRGEDLVLRRGHCRLAGALIAIDRGLPLEGVPVMQMEGNDEIDLLFDQETSNSGLRLDELAKGRLCLRARRLGVSDDEIARRMHWKAVGSVQTHIKMVEVIPEPVKQRIRDGLESATLALKLQKEDPAFAEQLRRENEEQNKKLGVGSRPKKLTQKTVTRAKAATAPKVEPPKPAPEPEASAPLASGLPATPETEGAPVSGVQSIDELKETIAVIGGIDGGGSEETALSFTPLQMKSSDLQFIETSGGPRPHNRIDSLLCGFIAASSAAEIAAMYAKLCRELEETRAETGDIMQGQEQLCIAADVIGQLRFPEDWENAKATTELQQVA